MGLISPQWVIYAVIAAVVGGYIWHCERQKEQFAVFKAQVEVLGKQAKAAAEKKDKDNAKQIKDALASRDVALSRLRSHTRSRPVSVLPTAPASVSGVCFTRAGFESAFGTLYTDLQGIAESGDTALINNRAWRDSWPK
jgi:hypothetical protein